MAEQLREQGGQKYEVVGPAGADRQSAEPGPVFFCDLWCWLSAHKS
jgi:hypothetical protein